MSKKLQKMIDQCVAASNEAQQRQHLLNEYCEERYGVAPGDVDADEIIDSVYGGCGQSTGMSATDFDEVMKRLTA